MINTGVRAEPRFLRDPTSLEYLSSGLSWVSLYLSSNLQKRQSSPKNILERYDPQLQKIVHEQYQPQQENNHTKDIGSSLSDSELVTFSTFQEHGPVTSLLSLLLLGYRNGFQVWDVTNPENVHETCSLRDGSIGIVQYMHILTNPQIDDVKDNRYIDPYAEVRPLVAIISSSCDYKNNNQEDYNNDTLPHRYNSVTRLCIFSLRTHQMIKDFTELTEQGISVGCTNERQISSLHILSTLDLLSKWNPLRDVYPHTSISGPIFALGSRYIAYTSTVTDLDRSSSNGFLTHIVNEKDLAGAAKDIAKEVVHGVKSLSEYSYHTISNYFIQQNNNATSATTTTLQYEANNTPSAMNNNSNQKKEHRRKTSSSIGNGTAYSQGAGSIMIRDLQKLQSVYVHFQAHNIQHPITQLKFNPSGTLLLSTTSQGHTFHIFSLVSSQGSGSMSESPVTHLYSLSRGITDAQVDDVRFSTDSLWCAVTTARGTTHLYPINPYGGVTEIPGHVQTKVINPKYHPHSLHRRKSPNLATSLNSIVRIRQRRSMHHEENRNQNINSNSQAQPRTPSGISSSLSSSSSSLESFHHNYISNGNKTQQHQPRAKLATQFLPVSKTSYLLNGGVSSPATLSQPWASSWKTQVANLLTSKGFSSNHGETNTISSFKSYLSYDRRTTTTDDRCRDNRMFGFDDDEEEQDHYFCYYRNNNEKRHSHSTIDSYATTASTGYQDMYSIHPEGILTLHRCRLTQTLVKKRENGRIIEKLELNVKEGDVAEWQVARKPGWDQVKMNYNANNKINKQRQRLVGGGGDCSSNYGNSWLSYAEITTYDPGFEKPLWNRHYSHISFHTFANDKEIETLTSHHDGDTSTFASTKNGNDQKFVPSTNPLALTQDAPEPYASRIDRVGRTSVASKDGALLDDAVVELEGT
ncbi:hypothetical protein BDA99DRAFT_562826 [Phascolomyces articulosus]|uniref:BCAS3 WD40 domain-containing protein n=1 Tax=Phascolomyces articulosus TaxID=60185 RepID=A0AAD5K3P1_9FUNG|nr:hypothetical protein BDA99DRAFT_562826 [Phascolomyces articulosus]